MDDFTELEVTEVEHASFRVGDGLGILCCCGLHNKDIDSVKAEAEFAANLTKEEKDNYFKACIKYMIVRRRTDDHVFVYNTEVDEEKHSISCIKVIVPVDQK